MAKKFNINDFNANPDVAIVTREGNAVDVLTTNKYNDPEFPVVGAVMRQDGTQPIFEWKSDGRYGSNYDDYDLYLDAQVFAEGYVNLYPNDFGPSKTYASREAADQAAKAGRVACIEVELEM
jgi:hypothetical protein